MPSSRLGARPFLLNARQLLLTAALLLAPSAGSAQDLVPVPDLRARVTDLTGTLEASQADALEAKLAALEDETGTQIAVLIVPTVRPEAIEQFALRVVESWRLGREDVDDGALLLVALEDREVRIEVGYGLEGALTDATSNRIIDEAVLPHFRTGDMYGGLAAGVDRMVAVARGEELPPPQDRSPDTLLPFAFAALLVAMIAGGILRALLGRVVGAAATGALTGAIVFAMSSLLGVAVLAGFGALLFTLVVGGTRGWTSRGRSGGFGRGGGWFGGGGFGGGGFGGGGFSGGGGGFGGGGASGSW